MNEKFIGMEVLEGVGEAEREGEGEEKRGRGNPGNLVARI